MSIYDSPILTIEFPRHKQILEDSIQLIQNTNNIDTLILRYNIALEHANWIIEQKDKGFPIYFDTEEEGFEYSLNRITNYHILRVAMEIFANYNKKIHSLKTAKAKDDCTVKMFEFIEKCNLSLKEHSNKSESESKLNKLHNNTEDIYSSNINNTERLPQTTNKLKNKSMFDETNQAYRTADYERWSRQPFTVGIEVKRSRSNKGPCPVCDAMVGKYPKDFKFIGWHPWCICYATPINLEGEDYLQYFFSGVVPEDKIIKAVPTKALEYINNNYEDLKNYYWADELLKLNSK